MDEFAPYYRSLVLERGNKVRARNAAYRRQVLAAARDGLGDMSALDVQDVLRERCRRDVLYFLNVFGWVFEPRPLAENLEKQILPFVTFPFQDEIIERMCGAWGRRDIDVLKTRDQGLTWIALGIGSHDFTFGEMSSGQLVSRKQDLVDKIGEQDTLFWKLLFLLNNLPIWMRPKYTKTFMSLVNDSTGYVVTGAATTGDVGRGGRKKWIIIDEYAAFSVTDSYAVDAATQHNTRCRVRISTPQGAAGAFYDCFQKKDSPSLQIRSHWSEHPYKNAGLYTTENGGLKLLDVTYWRKAAGFSDDVDGDVVASALRGSRVPYTFILDGKLRSPWYDHECRRTTRAWLIAQELDMDFLGSGNQYFDAAFLARLEETCAPPLLVGELAYDSDSAEPGEFTEREEGAFRLWCTLDAKEGRPKSDRRYVAGADVAQGTGASDSSLIVLDARTGEQVAEYVNNRLSPDVFARMCVAICRWFSGNDGFGARLAWEANGPGRSFGNKVLEVGYTNIYYRKKEDRVTKARTDFPGWYSTNETKQGLFGDLSAALNEDRLLVRSSAIVDEMRHYTWQTGGKIEHTGSTVDDASDSGDNHGDRVIAAAVALKCMGEVPSKQDEAPRNIPRNSIAGRRLEAQRRDSDEHRRGSW